MNERYQELTDWLITGLHDFDFVSESLLPEQYRETKEGFAVGKMCYSKDGEKKHLFISHLNKKDYDTCIWIKYMVSLLYIKERH